MTMKQKLIFGAIALLAIAPELISRRAPEVTRVRSQRAPVAASSAPVNVQTVRAEGVALARRGQALHDAGKYVEAVARFDSAAQKLPQINDWLNTFAATSLSHVGDTAGVRRRLTGLDPDITNEWAWRTRARVYAKAKSYERALEIAAMAARSGSASKRAAALYLTADIHGEVGRAAERKTTLLRVLSTAPSSDAGVDAARELSKLKTLTPTQRLEVGRALVRGGETTLGIASLRSFIKQTEDSKLRSQVRYELGAALFNAGNYEAAERELKLVPAGSARAADARFLTGRSQYRQDKRTAGTATFRRVAADYPKSRAATRALYFLGDLAQDDGRLNDAVTYFQRTAARHELGGDEPALALMRLGGIQYLRKDYTAARRTFETYGERYPRGVAAEQAKFWAAQAATALGQKQAARDLLGQVDARTSFSYYDIRAAELLGRDVLADLPPGPPRDTVFGPRVARGLGRWLLLRDIGWNEAAAFELTRLKGDVAGNKAALYSIAEELNENGHASAGIATGRELLQKGESWNARLLRIMFPMPYQEIIRREARDRGLDPFFVTALMRQESRFNHRAVSGAGAIGLMQVMPATGRQLGGGQVTRERLMDPEVNIRLGTKFLADLMAIYDAREDAVLVAYNAGPTRMDRWQDFPEFRSPDLFVERIPFEETRDYVKVIRVNTTIYRALYGD